MKFHAKIKVKHSFKLFNALLKQNIEVTFFQKVQMCYMSWRTYSFDILIFAISSQVLFTIKGHKTLVNQAHLFRIKRVSRKSWCYSCNKITTIWIQISCQNWYGFFSNANELQKFLDKKPSHINAKKNKKLALKLGIQTYQILTNDDEVCIPSLSSILLAVKCRRN